MEQNINPSDADEIHGISEISTACGKLLDESP
jgi:hypothetical protein